MTLNTDFNIPPYNDDYSEAKRFYRLLFRPSTAVQARELTQIQSILQNQIERFGDHVFKAGSIVQGCPITYYPNVHYISLDDYFNSNTALNPEDFDSSYLITNSTDSSDAVRAVIKIAKNGAKESFPDTNRIYFDYIGTGSNGSADQYVFEPGETLYFYSSVQGKYANLDANNLVDSINTLSSNGSFTSNGYAYCIGVGEGIIYQKGFFVKVEPHIITVRDYTTNVSNYVVGFDTTEDIVDEYDDESLYDNSLGYPNENAPGAHRLKLIPTLVSKSRTDIANNTNFFAIVEFDDSIPTKQADDPVYSAIGKSIADRTYEESGDYVIKPFIIESRVNDANNQTFFYEISPGIAYVRGNRIEKLGTTKIETTRGIDYAYAMDQIVTANYGNYVIVNELLGSFDVEKLVEVTLYDTPQTSLSEYEGNAAAVSGNAVGYANIRAIVFENGTRGLPSATYLVYLFNIRMNSGKSFSNDVKSIYVSSGGTFGAAKADLVLENGVAVLKESTRSTSLFQNGLQATRNLAGNTGIGDTSFVYNQVKSGTLDVTGSIALTIDSAASGGTEKLNSTSGSVLTGVSLDGYNFYVSANTYTANVSGTISISSGNAAITGTSLTTKLSIGQIIRISANSTNHLIRRVVSIANATYATIDSTPSVSNATAVFQYFYPGGTPLPIANVTINSNTSFTAQLGINVGSGSTTVYCSYPVNRTSAVAVPKVINKSKFVKLDLSNNAATTIGPWNLGYADIHKIKHVYLGTSYSNTNPDKVDWFDLDTGQNNDFYDHGKLIIKPQYVSQVNNTVKMLIELDVFTQNTTTSVGFFSVESYPIDDANTSNTNAIQTIEIPTFNGIDLRNCIDFRPRKYNTANISATESTATVNPPASNTSYNLPTNGHYMINPDNNFIADFSFYQPRIDLVTLNGIGNFSVVKGIPSTVPRVPFAENDQSVIAEVYVPPYPTATQREGENYKNIQLVKIKPKGNRRYTMKDIGVLDERLKRVEYYTVLNVLEQQARDLTIPDANGLDRFKNGIFADPFNSHLIGNVTDFEYKIAIDPRDTVARPYITRHNVDNKYIHSSSNNVQRTNSVVTLPYNNELYINQRFGTKYRNTSESVWQWNGKITLYPSFDYFRDETATPATNLSIDLATPWEDFANSPWGAQYGDWRTVGTNTSVSNNTNTTTSGLVTTTTTSTTRSTTTTQQLTIDSLKVNTITDTLDLGSYLKDISISPYMRSRVVAFVCYNMKPRTTLHAFFDDVNVDEYCAPGELSGATNITDGHEDAIVTRTGNFGDALVADETGFICGVFKIPANTFRTGDRLFQLTNVDDLVTGIDAKITLGKAKYSADNVTVTRGSTTLSLRQPQMSVTSDVQTRSTTTSTTETSTTIFIDSPPSPAPVFGTWGDGGSGDGDPLGQSFPINNIPSDVSGIFVTGIGLFFKSKSDSLGITVYICEMGQNSPNSTKIIGQSYKRPNDINVSDTGATETVFYFDYPIYLLSQNEYAFIVQPDANSPDFTIWTGEAGGYDVITGEQVYSNPFTGIMFTSANRSTWTPYQKEDIKFKIYRARFTANNGYAIFNNENDDYITVDGFTTANGIPVEVGDIVYSVNASSNATIVGTPTGRIQYINETTGELWLDSSTGGFAVNTGIRFYRLANNAAANTTNYIAYSNILSVNNLEYEAVVPQFGILQPSKTQIVYNYKGYSNTNVVDAAYKLVDNNTEYEFDDLPRHIMSRSNEISSISSNKSATFKLDLSTNNTLVSPVIDLTRKSTLFIQNMINNDANNEHTRYGSALSKYIGKKVVLADGQEAEDLKVYLTAYRPSDTDIKVYAKFKNNEDPEDFNAKVWTILEYDDGGDLVYSTSNGTDYREYSFSVPSTNAVAYAAFANTGSGTINSLTGTISIANNSFTISGTGTSFNTEVVVGNRIKIVSNTYEAIRTVTNITNATSMTVDSGLQAANSAALSYVFPDEGNDGIVEYSSASGSRYIGFKEFAIKIVLLSSNPVKVPKLNDVRVIACQR